MFNRRDDEPLNGLKYLLFIKEIPLKTVANQLSVTPQLIASWSNGIQRIPAHQLEKLSQFFQVQPELIRKELTLDDKIKIECQLDDQLTIDSLSELSGVYAAYKVLQKQLKESEQRIGYFQLQNQQLRHQLEEIRSMMSV